MNSALEHIASYIKKKNWTVDDGMIHEVLMDAKMVWKGDEDRRRHWNTYTFVVELDGMYIGFENAESTGDMSAWEKGYEFDIDTVCEYEPKEIKTTIFVPKS
jgi:hypothetical protein